MNPIVTVREVTSRYENFLLPVLPPGRGVCAVCKSVVLQEWELCYQCGQQRRTLSHTADVVAPIALAVKREQWAHELSSYKNSANPTARRTMTIGLSAVTWRWLDGHERCLAVHAGVDGFTRVTAIPSTRGRTDHPLPRMLREIIKPTSGRYVELLVPSAAYSAGSREAHDDRYLVSKRLGGEPVIVVDDQWTSGGHAQSAAAALKLAGSGPVAAVVLGRHFDRRPHHDGYKEVAETYYRTARDQGWDWDVCCLCAS